MEAKQDTSTVKQPIAKRVKPYLTRSMPIALHFRLDELSWRLRMHKQDVVNQALEIGVRFLEDTIKGVK